MKEHIDRYRRFSEDQKIKISSLRERVRVLEAELNETREKRKLIEEENQRKIEDIRSQLNRAVAGTFGSIPRQNTETVANDRSLNQNYSQNY